MDKIKLGLKDKKIIRALENNARKPFSLVAKEVGLSRESVSYKFRRLCENGVIAGSYTLINPARLGYSIFRVLFRLSTDEKDKTNKFTESFCNDNSIMWFASVGGKWDFIAEFMLKNAFEFSERLSAILKKFKNIIQSYEASIVLLIKFLDSRYILKDEKPRNVSEIGGKIESVELTNIDYKILELIKNNARLTNNELAKELEISRATVVSRLKRLQDNKIILGFNLFLSPNKIGMQSFKLLLCLKNLDSETEKRLFSFAEANATILYAHKNFGKWNAEFEAVVKDAKEIQGIATKTRTLFEQDLIDLEIIPIFKDYKINLFPEK